MEVAELPGRLPGEFGIEDEAYPEGNIVRQFFYAFRPPAAAALPAPRALSGTWCSAAYFTRARTSS